jgi:hypothetical protein
MVSHDMLDGKLTSCGLESCILIVTVGLDFSHCHHVQNAIDGHATSYPMVTVDFLLAKA